MGKQIDENWRRGRSLGCGGDVCNVGTSPSAAVIIRRTTTQVSL